MTFKWFVLYYVITTSAYLYYAFKVYIELCYYMRTPPHKFVFFYIAILIGWIMTPLIAFVGIFGTIITAIENGIIILTNNVVDKPSKKEQNV